MLVPSFDSVERVIFSSRDLASHAVVHLLADGLKFSHVASQVLPRQVGHSAECLQGGPSDLPYRKLTSVTVQPARPENLTTSALVVIPSRSGCLTPFPDRRTITNYWQCVLPTQVHSALRHSRSVPSWRVSRSTKLRFSSSPRAMLLKHFGLTLPLGQRAAALKAHAILHLRPSVCVPNGSHGTQPHGYYPALGSYDLPTGSRFDTCARILRPCRLIRFF